MFENLASQTKKFKAFSRHALVCSVEQQIDLSELNVLSRNVALPSDSSTKQVVKNRPFSRKKKFGMTATPLPSFLSVQCGLFSSR